MVKKISNIPVMVRRVNDMLWDLCEKNKMYLMGSHLQCMGKHILNNIFLKFLNNPIYTNSENPFWLNYSVQTSDFSSDIKGLIDLRKSFSYNP